MNCSVSSARVVMRRMRKGDGKGLSEKTFGRGIVDLKEVVGMNGDWGESLGSGVGSVDQGDVGEAIEYVGGDEGGRWVELIGCMKEIAVSIGLAWHVENRVKNVTKLRMRMLFLPCVW